VEIASGESIPLPNVGDIVGCKNVGGAVVGQTNKYKVPLMCVAR
jgi:hypothetical protein